MIYLKEEVKDFKKDKKGSHLIRVTSRVKLQLEIIKERYDLSPSQFLEICLKKTMVD